MKMKKILVIALCLVMALALTACKSSAAKSAEALIDAIGEVTAESEAAVAAAEEAFKALGEKERAQVENSAALEEARNTLEIVKTERLIDAIGEVTTDSEAAIKAAEEAFEGLSSSQQSSVANAQTLKDARTALEAALEEARKEAVKQTVLGTWRIKLDIGPLLATLLTEEASEYDISMWDYLSEYNVAMDLTLNDDDTYSILASKDMLDDENQRLHDACLGFLRELVMKSSAQECVNQGLTDTAPANWDELGAVLGMGEDDFFQLAYGTSKEEYADVFIGMLQIENYTDQLKCEGKFKVEEDKLFMNKDGSDTFGDDSEMTYIVKDDVLTLLEGSFDFKTALVSYPMSFDKVG
ncbi:MAG: hypothetical protein IK082_07375 [Oscillospiraceae bacterium]|nr:hypothetical protein [Oscillospiraceae bacterium]